MYSKLRSSVRRPCIRTRAVSFLLAAGLLGQVPIATISLPAARALEEDENPIFENALSHLVDWGIMKGYPDGGLHPNDPITRAEFAALVNRAYGHTTPGTISFSDVADDAWYKDDISIAYTAGYLNGTSDTTVNPTGYLTREQAMVLLAKNMRLTETPGEVTEFTDGHEFGVWSQGYAKSAVQSGLIAGYGDGTFRPLNEITRGEVGQMLYNAVGNLIQDQGEQTLTDIFGNLTISTTNTTLKDTVVSGDLYISGGLGLGAVTLDNVRVLGRIVVAGGGISEAGENSVILRNVEAKQLVVDNLSEQYVSISSEGSTIIGETTVVSDAFVQDQTRKGLGLLNIYLDGSEDSNYTLSGNLENVVDRAPGSRLNISQGNVQTLTVDETATDAIVNVDMNATVKTLNLDTGTTVTGVGDIERLNVNTDGSTVEMLPDQIVIRPGVTALVHGDILDSNTAQQSSADPRILAGYPKVRDIAPAKATGVFSGNKAGTLYWAVSSITDGSIGESELISPSTYGSKAVKNGNIPLSNANTEIPVAIDKLTSGGSYYLSAILVDERGTRSPVKVVSFSTPDNSVPAFATGYPEMSKITNIDAWVDVMATKTCKVYYALFPKGSSAPTEKDFRDFSLAGNLGAGVMDLTRNVPYLFQVNNKDLEELKEYDLYLWLTDADYTQKSAVKKLTFKTVDKTPPKFVTEPIATKIQTTSVGMLCNLNEKGTVYWVVVKVNEDYPKPAAGSTQKPALTSELAKLQVSSGMNALKAGSTAVQANKDATLNISGLEAESAYDVYYVAKDDAGNYSESVKKVTIHTLDNTPPKATQEFTLFSENDVNVPYAGTDVRLVFSETVQQYSTLLPLLDLYNKASATGADATAKKRFTDALRATIQLYNVTGSNRPALVVERTENTPATDPWTIDYRNATVQLDEDGKRMIVTFPTKEDGTGALNLSSGSTYYFHLTDIADTSSAINLMPATDLPRFTTIAAQVALDDLDYFGRKAPVKTEEGTQTLLMDAAFSMTPMSTETVDPSLNWDMLIWSDTTIKLELYQREMTPDKDPDTESWTQVGTEQSITVSTQETGYRGISLATTFKKLPNTQEANFSKVNSLNEDVVYQYAIRITELNGSADRPTWTKTVNLKIAVMSGSTSGLTVLGNNVTEANYQAEVANGLSHISIPKEFVLRAPFVDTAAPYFLSGYPFFDSSDTTTSLTVMLNRPGTVYYVVAPVGKTENPHDSDEEVTYTYTPTINTKGYFVKQDPDKPNDPNATIKDEDGDFSSPLNSKEFDRIPNPTEGNHTNIPYPPFLNDPGYLAIVNGDYSNDRIKTGFREVGSSAEEITVEGLEPEVDYFVYFVLKGAGQTYSSVKVYRFTMEKVIRPVIQLNLSNPIVNIGSNMTALVDYILVPYTKHMNELLQKPFYPEAADVFDQSEDNQKEFETWLKGYPDIKNKMYLISKDPDTGEEIKDPLYKFTVLDALATNVGEGIASKGSLFDLYATQSFKDQIATTIRSATASTSGSIIAVGKDISVPKDGKVPVDPSQQGQMSKGVEYALVAVGRSTLGSGDAFRAIFPVTLNDKTPPKVIEVVKADFLYNLNNTNPSEDTVKQGRIVLNFDEPLYYAEKDSSGGITLHLQVDNAPLTDSNRIKDKFISVEDLRVVESSSKLLILSTDSGSVNKETQSISIQCDGIPARTTSTIAFRRISDVNSNTNTEQLNVQISFTPILDETDETSKKVIGYEPVVTITSVWDGQKK